MQIRKKFEISSEFYYYGNYVKGISIEFKNRDYEKFDISMFNKIKINCIIIEFNRIRVYTYYILHDFYVDLEIYTINR